MTKPQLTAGQVFTYLVRHGLTDWNAEKRIQGQTNVPLNATGLQQAEAVAAWIAQQPVQFRAIYTSDQQRALKTAQIIGGRLNLIPIPTIALREVHCGEWEGLTTDEVEAKFPGERAKWRMNRETYVPLGGEGLFTVRARVAAFYWDMIQRHPAESILIVAHGASLLTLLSAVENLSLMETWRDGIRFFGNTGVTILARSNGEHRVVARNLLEHWPEADIAE